MGVFMSSQRIHPEDDKFMKNRKYRVWFDSENVNHFSRVSPTVCKQRSQRLINYNQSFPNPEGNFYVAVLFEQGFGIKRNINTAIKYYKKSAKQNWRESLHRLAFFYKNGIGVELNEKKAFKMYKLAAEHGSLFAMKRVSSFYREGFGIERNEEKAIEYMNRYRTQKELNLATKLRKEEPVQKLEEELKAEEYEKDEEEIENEEKEDLLEVEKPKLQRKLSWQAAREKVRKDQKDEKDDQKGSCDAKKSRRHLKIKSSSDPKNLIRCETDEKKKERDALIEENFGKKRKKKKKIDITVPEIDVVSPIQEREFDSDDEDMDDESKMRKKNRKERKKRMKGKRASHDYSSGTEMRYNLGLKSLSSMNVLATQNNDSPKNKKEESSKGDELVNFSSTLPVVKQDGGRRRRQRSKSVMNPSLTLALLSKDRSIKELRAKLKIIREEKERAERKLMEEKQIHIRTQQTLRQSQKEYLKLRKQYVLDHPEAKNKTDNLVM